MGVLERSAMATPFRTDQWLATLHPLAKPGSVLGVELC